MYVHWFLQAVPSKTPEVKVPAVPTTSTAVATAVSVDPTAKKAAEELSGAEEGGSVEQIDSDSEDAGGGEGEGTLDLDLDLDQDGIASGSEGEQFL
jgi:hypothetical protein